MDAALQPFEGAARDRGVERREESALRRSGRPVPDTAYAHFEGIDPRPLEAILEDFDHDPRHMLQILEATQASYGYLPVAALKLISHRTGAWYAMIYGTASYYSHLRFEPPGAGAQAAELAERRPTEATYIAGLAAALAGAGRPDGGAAAGAGRKRRDGGRAQA